MNLSSVTNFDSNGEYFNYCVYAHICKVSGPDYGRTYIGVTNNIKTRWRLNGGDYRHTTELYKAFQKYGWDNFLHIVLIENVTISMADVLERELIKKFNTNYKNGGFGYNANDGGISYRKPIKEIYQYDINGIYIQTFDDIEIAAMTVGCDKKRLSDCLNTSHFTANYLWSSEYLDSMPEYKYISSYNRYINKPILQVQLDGKILNRYNNIYEINDYNKGNIIKSCKNKYAQSGGFIWVFETDYTFDNIEKRIQNYNKLSEDIELQSCDYSARNISSKSVDLYDINSNFIKTYSSINQASDDLKINRHAIVQSCECPGINIGNYLFSYHNKNVPQMNYKYIAIKLNDNSAKYKFKTKEQIIEFIQRPSKYGRINEVCRGERKSAYGYYWRYLDNDGNIIEPENL